MFEVHGAQIFRSKCFCVIFTPFTDDFHFLWFAYSQSATWNLPKLNYNGHFDWLIDWVAVFLLPGFGLFFPRWKLNRRDFDREWNASRKVIKISIIFPIGFCFEIPSGESSRNQLKSPLKSGIEWISTQLSPSYSHRVETAINSPCAGPFPWIFHIKYSCQSWVRFPHFGSWTSGEHKPR